jgi:DNA polymerase/3'-5' exonuclease PolX
VGNRERALQVFAAASYLQARGANPYRVRAYQRAALRLLRMSEDAEVHLDERGELDLPGLGQRLRRKLGELVRTGRMSFHDELIAAEPRPIRTLMTVPGIGPKTADRLVDELKIRGLKGLARAARRGRLHRLRGVGPAREQAWGEAAELLLTPARIDDPRPVTPAADAAPAVAAVTSPAYSQMPLLPAEMVQPTGAPGQQSGPERAA